jgi:hypothetical protein
MNFLAQNVWVWAGTGLVLITLSGQTRRMGIIISLVAVVVHIITSLISKDEE